MDKNLAFATGVLLFATIGLTFSVGFLAGQYNGLNEQVYITSEIEVKTNMSTSEVAMYLYDEVGRFYNYNISNANNKLTINELKTQGGVCRHYATYYVERAKEMGFMGQTVSFWGNNKSQGHMISLIYDDKLKEYCILDQSFYPRCFELGSPDIGT